MPLDPRPSGIEARWTGRDIVVPVPDSEAIGAKAAEGPRLMEVVFGV